MPVKAVKAKLKNGHVMAVGKRAQKPATVDLEALYTGIENDPQAPVALKELVAYRRQREQSGEPYLTVEQILAELERD